MYQKEANWWMIEPIRIPKRKSWLRWLRKIMSRKASENCLAMRQLWGKRLQTPSESDLPHEKIDTYCPQGDVHDCAGGGRAACGIIEAVEK